MKTIKNINRDDVIDYLFAGKPVYMFECETELTFNIKTLPLFKMVETYMQGDSVFFTVEEVDRERNNLLQRLP